MNGNVYKKSTVQKFYVIIYHLIIIISQIMDSRVTNVSKIL